MSKGPLIILSGPSGSGKSTVIHELLGQGCGRRRSDLPLHRAVSLTTRPKRTGEQEGVDYHFCTEEEFRRHREAGELVEWARVHDHYYGTPRSEVDAYLARGIGVILVIDVQGAAQVRRQYPDHLSIFLTTSTPEIYEQRLRDRGTEKEADLQTRLRTAQRELARSHEYQHLVYNDDLDQAVRQLSELIGSAFRIPCDETNR